jgi:hypothetical protein
MKVETFTGFVTVLGMGIVAGVILVFFNAYVANPVERKVGLAA